MSPEKQRIAIAKACGWLDIQRGSRRGTRTPNGNTLWATKDTPSINYPREYSIVPDYLNDLNELHEAEGILYSRGIQDNWREVDRYRQLLSEAIGEQDIFNADAPTRAKCFLKTLNLWTDD